MQDGLPRTARAVLFDMDGVITLNSHYHAEAWQHFAQEQLGLAIALDDQRIHGGLNADILASLTGRPATDAEGRGMKSTAAHENLRAIQMRVMWTRLISVSTASAKA